MGQQPKPPRRTTPTTVDHRKMGYSGDVHHAELDLQQSPGALEGGGFVSSQGLNVTVAAGRGFIYPAPGLWPVLVEWTQQTVLVAASTTSYIYVDATGTLKSSTARPSYEDEIELVVVAANVASIIAVAPTHAGLYRAIVNIHRWIEEAIGPLCVSGGVVSIYNPPSLQLEITKSEFFTNRDEQEGAAAAPMTMISWWRDGGTGWKHAMGVTAVDSDYYDDGSGTLAALPQGKWKKDAIYVVANAQGTTYHYIYAQEYFNTEAQAHDGPLPAVDALLSEFAMRAAGVLLGAGLTAITEVLDARPFIGQKGVGTMPVSSHANLTELDYADSGHTGFAPTVHTHDGGDITSQVADSAHADDADNADVADAVRETSGPTVLAMGAVADGEYLKRSGATIIGGTPSGGGDPYILQPWDSPPVSPSAYDDEFTDAATLPGGGSAIWTWLNQGFSTVTISHKKARFVPEYNASPSNRVIYQAAPAAPADFTVACKFRQTAPKINYVQTGIVLISAASKLFVFGFNGQAGGLNVSWLRWNSVTSYNTQGTLISGKGHPPPEGVFIGANQSEELMFRFRVDRTGGNIYCEISADGEYWRVLATESIAGFLSDVAYMGLLMNHENTSSSDVRGDFSWFRVNWTPDYS
jgi:hypothetical protein